ncbi:MAG TPA: roadblock/LC7 domain-containing protein [Kofleriaceae bacterium]|nr:roadblock/LC7 domain-containing protein [Kofleriaceae bacterium]
MRTIERRRRRATLVTQALCYQLEACCEDGRIHAMVVADRDGLPLASSGDPSACDEVAASMVHVAARTHEFSGTLFGNGRRWDVEMRKVPVDHGDLFVCAVGGSPEQRQRQLVRGARGAQRILTVA